MKVKDLPEDDLLHQAHRKSIYNRQEIEVSKNCGCFYCRKIFDPDRIKEWVDTEGAPVSQHTALCPYCGIDSVIGDASGFEITIDFLRKMKRRFF